MLSTSINESIPNPRVAPSFKGRAASAHHRRPAVHRVSVGAVHRAGALTADHWAHGGAVGARGLRRGRPDDELLDKA